MRTKFIINTEAGQIGAMVNSNKVIIGGNKRLEGQIMDLVHGIRASIICINKGCIQNKLKYVVHLDGQEMVHAKPDIMKTAAENQWPVYSNIKTLGRIFR